jgi:death-on-curing protein
MTRNHPFVDGNKRTAWMLAVVFLDRHDYDLAAEMPDALQAMLALSAGSIAEADFAAWLRDRLSSLSEARFSLPTASQCDRVVPCMF